MASERGDERCGHTPVSWEGLSGIRWCQDCGAIQVRDQDELLHFRGPWGKWEPPGRKEPEDGK